MCYYPNIRDNTKGQFKGSMRNYIKYNNRGKENNEQIKEIRRKEIITKTKKGEWSLIPCGQCIQCRLKNASNWAARCEVETQYHQNNHFVTLTYDDDHVPVHNIIDDTYYKGIKNPIEYVQGEPIERLTLYKKDMQDFLKRLRIRAQREKLEEEGGIKVFYCGEYGDKSARPHYHIIIYGLKIPDLKLHYRKKGYEHDTSEWLSQIWGQGLVDIGGVTYDSAAYVAKYIVKKRIGRDETGKLLKEWYNEMGIAPEFIAMSNRGGGIGKKYWEEHRDEIYSLDKMYLKKGRAPKPPKYYDNLEEQYKLAEEMSQEIEEFEATQCENCGYFKYQSNFMKKLKEKRAKNAQAELENELKKQNLPIEEYMEIKAENFRNLHKKSLDRSTIDKI